MNQLMQKHCMLHSITQKLSQPVSEYRVSGIIFLQSKKGKDMDANYISHTTTVKMAHIVVGP